MGRWNRVLCAQGVRVGVPGGVHVLGGHRPLPMCRQRSKTDHSMGRMGHLGDGGSGTGVSACVHRGTCIEGGDAVVDVGRGVCGSDVFSNLAGQIVPVCGEGRLEEVGGGVFGVYCVGVVFVGDWGGECDGLNGWSHLFDIDDRLRELARGFIFWMTPSCVSILENIELKICFFNDLSSFPCKA